MSTVTVSRPVFEHNPHSVVVDTSLPRISWKFEGFRTTDRVWTQSAYEIEVQIYRKRMTHRIASDQSVLVPWPTEPLKSRETATVRVRSYGSGSDARPCVTDWSSPAKVEVALLNLGDWTAKFIVATEQTEQDGVLRPLRFWKSFELPDDFKSHARARLYVTSLGIFDVSINGLPASDELMAPGWTSYEHRLTYRTIDVGSLLNPGLNVICLHVAEGWYAGRLGFKGGKRFCYGSQLGALAQLELQRGGVSSWVLNTDESWTWTMSEIRSSGIYDGEIYDDRLQEDSWMIVPRDPRATRILPWPQIKIVPSVAPPVRVTERITAQQILQSPSGRIIVDFGQNLVGKVQITSPRLDDGAQITIRHAEVLEHGELGIRPLRFARATDIIIGSGRAITNWSPKFTFHGFRYVEIEGWPSPARQPEPDDIVALVMHSDMRRRGSFSCSNASVNKLHQNVVWSMKGNFLSIPTDCPQRDERLGWTGDIQVFTPTASFLYDTTDFLSSWLADVTAEQLEVGRNGIPPLVVPDVIPPNWPQMPQAVWDDVTVLTPYDLYQSSGDVAVLKNQFDSMRAWVDQGIDRGPDGLWSMDRWQLGDWLDPTAPPQDPGNGRTDGTLVADAYLVRTTETLSRVCNVLGHADLASKYSNDAAHLRREFQQKYLSPGGNIASNTQTAIALAVQHRLYDPAHTNMAAKQLSRLVRLSRFRIATGFAGTPVITHALTALGLPQLAYRMLLEKSCPSWMYPITMGATTIWERWDSMLPNGDINPGEMTSFNHYALGAVAEWLHTTVGGLTPVEPGWKTFKVRPIPGGNITWARVSYESPYGRIECSWTWTPTLERDFELRLSVPPCSTAIVTLPSEWQLARITGQSEKEMVVGPGEYRFKDVFDAGEWPPLPIVASNQPIPVANIAE